LAKIRQFKPGKKEIIASVVIFGVVGVIIVFSSFPALTYGAVNMQTAAPGPLSSTTQNSGFVQNQFGSSVSSNRVVNTSEALVGELRHGQFEPVTGEIISNLNSIGGYIVSSNLMYNGTTWFGLYAVNVPSSDATIFLFNVTNLVNQHGATTSVQIQTQDVTNQTGGNQSKVPYALFDLTLQEEANTTMIRPQTQFSGIFGSIGSILGVVLSGAAYVVLLAVPIYLLVLGGVLLSGRILYPIFLKVSKNSQPKESKSIQTG
jgi:hypothetical protein